MLEIGADGLTSRNRTHELTDLNDLRFDECGAQTGNRPEDFAMRLGRPGDDGSKSLKFSAVLGRIKLQLVAAFPIEGHRTLTPAHFESEEVLAPIGKPTRVKGPDCAVGKPQQSDGAIVDIDRSHSARTGFRPGLDECLG